MSKPTSTGQMPVYIPAGTVGSPLNSTKVSAAPRGSAFASVTNGVLMPDQSSGPVVTTHNGNGALLDVNENADLGLDLFDVIDVYHANEAYKLQSAGELQVANEMLMLAATFQRRFEPRNSAQTVTPPVPLFANFQFPRNVAWHFVSTDGVQKGPDPNDPKIFDLRKKVTVSAVSHLESTLGNPVPLAFNLGAEVSKWHRNVRVFIRRTDAVRETPNENMLPVVNYSWLAHAYRYMRTIYTERYRWENIWRTVFQNINSYLMGGDQRTHFVFVDLPKVLVGIEKMRRLITAPPQTLIRTITDDQQWMIFELWKWIDPEIRHTSMLSAIDPQVLDRVRIVLVDGARFTVFNPKSINDWTIDPRDLSRKTATITGVQMQRRFLRGCMTVMEYRNPEVDNSADGREGVIEADSDMASPRDGEDHTQARSSQVEQAQTPEGVAPGSLAPLERDGEMGQSDASIDQSMVSSAAKRAESILLTMDDDLAALDEIDDMKSLDLDKVLDAKIEESSLLPQTPAKSSFDFEMTVQDDLTKRVETLADRGAITVVDYRKLNRLIEKSKTLPSAYASGATMVEFAAVKQEETQLDMAEKLPDRNTVTEKTMLQNSLRSYNKRYIEEVLPRDITAMLLQVQSGGAIITDHQIEIQEDAMNAYEFHTVRYQPIEGVSTPLRFKIPVLSKTGRMKSNGTSSVARMQRVDLPIRKVAYNRVALSSYYGKNFVNLNERSAYNYDVWMSKEVMLKSIGDAPQIEHALTGDVFDHTLDAPRAFSALSHGYRTFRCAGVDFFFDKKLRDKAFKPELYEVLAQDKLFPVGRKGEVVYALDENNTLYECKPGENTPIDSIENFLGLRSENLPLEHAICRIFSKDVPVGLVLGYYYGFNELIKMLGARVRYVPTGTRVNAAPNEWSLAFEDQTVVFSRDDRLATLIFGGLKNAEKALKRYALALFDQPAVYFQVIEYMGMTGRMIREFDNLRNMFIDPITRRVLVKMGEPTTYPGLIKRACELLLTSKCSRKLDMREMRVRGTERIAGAIYTEMVNTMRAHNAKVSKASAKLDLHPYDIWNSITRDRSVVQVKDINPINALKEVEAVTFSGNGGRSSQTMMKEDRYFDPTDMGLIGESTPDSSEVGVSTYTVGVPRFANMEGMILPPEFDKTDASSLLTTTALISPSSMRDDPKRTSFVNVQHGHGISCENYKVTPLLTGYESTIADRVENDFAATAKKAGKVVSLNAKGVIVQYEDGEREGFEIGRRYGASAGMTIPHDLVPNVKMGEEFKAGDVLTYHKGYFKPDTFDKTKVHWMNGTICTVALLESRKTHEDACSVSSKFGGELVTSVSTIKKIVVGFNQQLRKMVAIGDEVGYGQELCFIEDSVTSNTDLFSEDTLNTLRYFSGQAPTSKVAGRIDNIEVYYHGHPDDMSPTLKEITLASDNRLQRARRSAAKLAFTGAVDETFSVGGEPLLMDTAVVYIYITHKVKSGVGDKMVLGNQLKTEISEVYDYNVSTANGESVEVIFGALSVFNRIVNSVFINGTTISLLDAISKRASSIYFGK